MLVSKNEIENPCGGDRGALCPRPSALALHLVVSACPGRWLPACHTRCHDGDIMMCVAAAWFCLFEDRERVSVDDFMEAVRQRRERERSGAIDETKMKTTKIKTQNKSENDFGLL